MALRGTPAQAVSGRLEAEIWEDIVTFAIDADVIAEPAPGEREGEQEEALRQEAEGRQRQLAGVRLRAGPHLRSTAGRESTKRLLTDSGDD